MAFERSAYFTSFFFGPANPKCVRPNFLQLDFLRAFRDPRKTEVTMNVFKRVVRRVFITPVNLIGQSCFNNQLTRTNLNYSVGSLAAWSIYPQVTNGHLAGESTRNLNPRQMLGFWRLALRHNADHIPACLQYGQSQHPHLCVISTTEN